MIQIGLVSLYSHELEALKHMKNGCILCGGVGSGKSITSIAYYYLEMGGSYLSLTGKPFITMKNPIDLYIITTARKRDLMDWDGELSHFLLSTEKNFYKNKVVVDSWNNIKKYKDVTNAFFIFDEQRVVGSGVWVQSFLKITKRNPWILLSATPGDTWQDYIPVFLANGFYKNKTDFKDQHIIYSRFSKFPKVERYVNTRKLERLRDSILIEMTFERSTVQHHENIEVSYDPILFKEVQKKRWNPFKDQPIKNASELCYVLRRVVNSDDSRRLAILEIFEKHKKVIIFYNFDYELEILKNINYGPNCKVAEWNGHHHETIPETDEWIYLVQYTAGAEGWNCIKTNTIIFYSLNYSYKVMVQSAGRIDRLNTPYVDLYYFHLLSKSWIDAAIMRAVKNKKNFNTRSVKFEPIINKGAV